MSHLSEMVFDSLDTIEIPVRIAGKSYVLCEASEHAAVTYNNARGRLARIEGSGKTIKVIGIGDIADLEPLLVSLCLFEVIDPVNGQSQSTRQPVTESTIRMWPARIVKQLHDRAKQISELDEREDEAALVEKMQELQEKLAETRKGDAAKNGQHATPIKSA